MKVDTSTALTDTGSLIAALQGTDRDARKEARRALVALGRPAVRPLIKALKDCAAPARWEVVQILGEIKDRAAVTTLVKILGHKDGTLRQYARQSLVALGRPAVRPLVKALTDRREQVRWEATKTLADIADPAAAPALVALLEDKNFGIRWLAAEALVAIGREALVPLLQALKRRADSVWLREGAHFILRNLNKLNLPDIISPVQAALDDVQPEMRVPLAAQRALELLGR